MSSRTLTKSGENIILGSFPFRGSNLATRRKLRFFMAHCFATRKKKRNFRRVAKLLPRNGKEPYYVSLVVGLFSSLCQLFQKTVLFFRSKTFIYEY